MKTQDYDSLMNYRILTRKRPPRLKPQPAVRSLLLKLALVLEALRCKVHVQRTEQRRQHMHALLDFRLFGLD